MQLSSGIDARDDAALVACQPMRTGEEAGAARCGIAATEVEVDWDRLDRAALTLDAATVAHVLTIGAEGSRQGRNPRAFGMVGDSMTASNAFMRPFSALSQTKVELAVRAQQGLATHVPGQSAATIIDFYRGARAQRVGAKWLDAFGAAKAAKNGARASWSVHGDERDQSRIASLVETLSPAVAVITFGGNDATFLAGTAAEVIAPFDRSLRRAIHALERRGVVPILSTIARHGHQPNLPDCGATPRSVSNWRIAVHTNAISAHVAEVACELHLPLVDLHDALDGCVNRGLDPDGVHPSWHLAGAGVLTARGLQCGYNVRNYVTLRMLKLVKETLEQGGVW